MAVSSALRSRKRDAVSASALPQPQAPQAADADAAQGYVLTRAVVAHHDAPNNAWVIYKGHVYDVTTFLSSHPGGASALLPFLGRDVAEAMGGSGDGGSESHDHSTFAFKLLEKYRIGRLADADGQDVPDGNTDPVTRAPLVAWDEPILHQVGMLGAAYERWIHSFPTTDHSVKMFTNDTVENLTKCPWYIPLLVWIPVMALELVHYVHLAGGVGQVDPFVFVVSALAGALFWLWFEYSLHRWIFHWEPKGYYAIIFHFLIHGHHHITPMDFDRLVFPPIPALLVGWPFWYAMPKYAGIHVGYPWLIGFVSFYLVYDMTHFWIHHGVPANKFLRAQKRRHVHHHYFKPSVNFGISNPLFDIVCGTLVEPERE